jgi:hypothetical protein
VHNYGVQCATLVPEYIMQELNQDNDYIHHLKHLPFLCGETTQNPLKPQSTDIQCSHHQFLHSHCVCTAQRDLSFTWPLGIKWVLQR